MKRLISWLAHYHTKRSKSHLSPVAEDIREACLTYGGEVSGVHMVMRQYYSDYVY